MNQVHSHTSGHDVHEHSDILLLLQLKLSTTIGQFYQFKSQPVCLLLVLLIGATTMTSLSDHILFTMFLVKINQLYLPILNTFENDLCFVTVFCFNN